MQVIRRKIKQLFFTKKRFSWRISITGLGWPDTLTTEFLLWRAKHGMVGRYYNAYTGVWFTHRRDADSFYHWLDCIRVKAALYA